MFFMMALLQLSGMALATQIDVKLFGHDCKLEGPVDERALRAIHAISPDQITPDSSLGGSKPYLKSIEILKKNKEMSPQFDRYRERLAARLEAQAAFWQEFEKLPKTRAIDTLLKSLKRHLRPGKESAALTELRKLKDASSKTDAARTILDTAFSAFNDAIEMEPDDDFHRAIHKLQIQYLCDYDGAGDHVPTQSQGPASDP